MTVFSSVSKGVLAKKEDLQLVFGTDDEEKVCLKILAEGEFQVQQMLAALMFAFVDFLTCSITQQQVVHNTSDKSSLRAQLSDKERDVELQNLFRDVASILAEKCVNPQSSKPYTITVLERALKDIHFSVDPKRSAKQQALAVR